MISSKKKFTTLVSSMFIITILFACNDKKQELPPIQEKNSNGVDTRSGQITFTPEITNATSATTKANEKGTGFERYVTKEAKNTLAFDVRGDKLEAVINNTKLGVSFGTPRNYQNLSFGALPVNDIARKFTEFTSPEISVTPLYTFGNGQNSMVVSQIKLLIGQTPEQFIDNYEAINKSRFAPANFITTSFKNRDIPMTQFFIQEAESGLFRIVFPTTRKNLFLQFDYTARKNSIQSDIESIDPSIGSITRIVANNP